MRCDAASSIGGRAKVMILGNPMLMHAERDCTEDPGLVLVPLVESLKSHFGIEIRI